MATPSAATTAAGAAVVPFPSLVFALEPVVLPDGRSTTLVACGGGGSGGTGIPNTIVRCAPRLLLRGAHTYRRTQQPTHPRRPKHTAQTTIGVDAARDGSKVAAKPVRTLHTGRRMPETAAVSPDVRAAARRQL